MTSKITKTMTAKMVYGTTATAGEFLDFLEGVPVSARITIAIYRDVPRDRDPTQTTITATWEL